MAIPSLLLVIGESRLCTMDFSGRLARGVSISSVTSVVADLVTVPPLVIGAPTFSNSLVQFQVSGGLGDTKYKIKVFVATTTDPAVEGEGYLQCIGPSNFVVTPAAGGVGAAGH